MPVITARVSQATFDLFREKGIQVGVVLEWIAGLDLDACAKEEGWTVPRKPGRAKSAKTPTQPLVKTPPKRS
jgi:hypothetical protein